MPELPEVETVRRTLEPHLTGKRIETFDLRWHRTLQAPDLASFTSAIVGRTIVGVNRRGKLVVLEIDDGSTVTIHLRMTGELLFQLVVSHGRNDQRESHLRAVFGFSDGSALLFYDTRKFGKIAWYPQDPTAPFDRLIGVEPLSDEFTVEALNGLLSSRRRQLKPVLLDQSVIAGLGNIYVDEALFRSRIHPLAVASNLSPAQVARLHEAIVTLLRRAVESRGTTLRDYRTGLGDEGTYQRSLRVYGFPPGSPCPECGTPLERLVIGQRGSIFCPNCQELTTPDTLDRS